MTSIIKSPWFGKIQVILAFGGFSRALDACLPVLASHPQEMRSWCSEMGHMMLESS
jgi:hypothetical protein